jgi:hypothetical protein
MTSQQDGKFRCVPSVIAFRFPVRVCQLLVVSCGTGLQAGLSENRGSDPGRGKRELYLFHRC